MSFFLQITFVFLCFTALALADRHELYGHGYNPYAVDPYSNFKPQTPAYGAYKANAPNYGPQVPYGNGIRPGYKPYEAPTRPSYEYEPSYNTPNGYKGYEPYGSQYGLYGSTYNLPRF